MSTINVTSNKNTFNAVNHTPTTATLTHNASAVTLLALPLIGKVALVTGASRGIGAGIAKSLAEAGADVAISYSASPDKAQEVVKSIESFGRRGLAIRADHAKQEEVTALVHSAVKHFGKLDILVNNAGISVLNSPTNPDDNTPEKMAEIARLWAINLTSVATAVRAAAPYLPSGGRIITIGSTTGNSVPMASLADYSATKSALKSYTKGWVRDFAPKGVTVNLVQPGPIATDLNPADGPHASYVRSMVPLGRHGTPAEIGAAVVFLASPAASFVTGAILDVDGGQSA